MSNPESPVTPVRTSKQAQPSRKQLTPKHLSPKLTTHVSSLRQNELKAMLKRKASVASNLSYASSTDEFLDGKIENAIIDVEYVERLMKGLKEARDDGVLSEVTYREALHEANGYSAPKEQELVVLKRQKKIVKEDLEERLPLYATLEAAYADVIVNKTMAASSKAKKDKRDAYSFKKEVLEFYSAGRHINSKPHQAYDEAYCPLTGWQASKTVKAAHIVPRALQSDELSYLFGVGEAVLTDTTNALPLAKVIEGCLDAGKVVFVPLKTHPGTSETIWKCVVTDKNTLNNMIYPGKWWRDVDGVPLKFLSAARPARRFLYFRFVITYLQCKRDGTMGWVEEVEAKGTLWATPGPYLRKSMLIVLARRISDTCLPETFYEQTTFDNNGGAPTRSSLEEEELAQSLIVREKEYRRQSGESEDEEDEEDE